MKTPAVLIVDDELGVRETLKIVFGKDYIIIEADCKDAAIKKLEDSRPAVVLLDVLMPKTDGFEVLRQIKTIHPDCEVIMLTALNTRQVADRAMRAGAFDLVGKPFDVVDLRRKIELALAKVAQKSSTATPQT